MAETERLKAIVLRRTNYGEADRIVQLVTPHGRRSAMAKGVRKEKSRLKGGIELFAVCDLVLRSGRGELQLITSARLVAFYRHILEDYERMQFAYEALGLVTKASEHIDESDWFRLLQETLEALDTPTLSRQFIETWFYVQYAAASGDDINLERDVSGERLEAGRTYMYDVSERALRRSDQGDIEAEHIKLLRLMSQKSLQVVSQVGGVEAIMPDCWLMARQHVGV